jgi:very-short-patch-repair endonuclease
LWREFAPLTRRKRREATIAEDKLWQALRTLRPGGFKFRRQHAIGPFIVNFYCVRGSLVIEVDGSSHDGREEDDEARQEHLEGLGLRVVRFKNHQVIDGLPAVSKRVEEAWSAFPSPRKERGMG